MTDRAKKILAKAKAAMSKLSIKMLCESFELTNTRNYDGIDIARGWLMDELYRRDSVKFLEWLETDDVELMDTPSKFFL